MANIIKTDIEGIINELNISPADVLYPFYETVVNSIQSIMERKEDGLNGKIIVDIERDKTQTELFEKYEHFPIKSIKVTDNGIGFTPANFESFEHAHSTKKIKLGGKGLGRFAILSVFNKINVESIIKDKETNKRIIFSLSRHEGLSSPVFEDTNNNLSTTITLEKLNSKFKIESSKYSHEMIADNILSHCLLYYLDGNVPEIDIIEEGITINLSHQFVPRDYVKYIVKDKTIKGKPFYWYFVKNEKARFHELLMCGHNRKVKGKRIDKVFPLFSSPYEDNNVMYFFTVYVVSPYLDSIVNMSRNEFNFPKIQKEADVVDGVEQDLDISKESELIIEHDIDEKTIEVIKELFPELVEERMNVIQKKVESFLSSDDGLEYRHLAFDDSFYFSLQNDIDEKGLDDKLHDYQFKKSKEAKKKRDRLFRRDYSNKEDYQNLLKEVVDTATLEGYSRLAQYVSHRKTIIELLEKYLHWSEENNNYEEEEVLHNLIYTMGGNQNTIPYDKHNLWLLDKRMNIQKSTLLLFLN